MIETILFIYLLFWKHFKCSLPDLFSHSLSHGRKKSTGHWAAKAVGGKDILSCLRPVLSPSPPLPPSSANGDERSSLFPFLGFILHGAQIQQEHRNSLRDSLSFNSVSKQRWFCGWGPQGTPNPPVPLHFSHCLPLSTRSQVWCLGSGWAFSFGSDTPADKGREKSPSLSSLVEPLLHPGQEVGRKIPL